MLSSLTDTLDMDFLYTIVQNASLFSWVLALIQFYIFELSPLAAMNSLSLHGKLGSLISPSAGISFLFVRKSNFKWFYAVGGILAVIVAIGGWIQGADAPRGYLVASLFAVHCFRRVWECVNITSYGESTIHVMYFIGGMVHYVFVALTLVATIWQEHATKTVFSHWSTFSLSIALSLFVLSNAVQCHSHWILFQLKSAMHKKTSSTNVGPDNSSAPYPLPRGGGFEFCMCPHYLAEIGIYLSFTVLCHDSPGMITLLVWVICNLSYTATQHCEYYLRHYPHESKRILNHAIFPPFL